ASALLSAFAVGGRVDGASSLTRIQDHYRAELRLLVRRLILLSVAPPAATNYDAQIMLGSLASYAFDPVSDWLVSEERRSPLAYRLWRAITKLVKFRGNGAHSDDLQSWVRQLVRASGDLRKRSLYAGRSLDLELALAIPASWCPASDDWV